MKRISLLALSLIILTNMSAQTNADVVLNNIATRTSVRSFTSQPVPDEMVQTILKAGMAAPSAINFQPWEFIVVNDRAVLDKLAEGLKNAKMLLKAPIAIVVCAHTTWERGGEVRENIFWEHDASAATQNILLAAHALGLGAVWTAASDEQRSSHVIQTLGIEGDVMPLCVIPMGFPDKENQPKDKWKPEKIHYNKW